MIRAIVIAVLLICPAWADTGHDTHFIRLDSFYPAIKIERREYKRPSVLSINILGGHGLLTTPAGFGVIEQSPSITWGTYRMMTKLELAK